MNMQQFTGWVTRLLDALPWRRRAQRPPRPLMAARVTSPPKANRFIVPDDHDLRRQKTEANPLCSTLHEDLPADHAPPTTPQPLLLPAPETSSAPLLALPAPPSMGAAEATAPSEQAGEPQPFHADPERRMAFVRYLFRQGVFNEGFTGEVLPAQYRDQVSQD